MIVTQDLTKKYANDFVALNKLNISIREGEIYGYIGPNGAGKTTTIRILCGLLRPTSGKACINGCDVTHDLRAIRALVGYMPDTFGVYEEMRVWEYLDFFGACHRIPRKKRRERIAAVLDITRSEAMRDYFVDTLSHGMRQRIGIARTLMHDPKVLFLDEPTNGLDPRARVEMRTFIKDLARLGKTVLVSSHILPELAVICDRVGIIERGSLLAQGTVEQIMRRVQPNRLIEVSFLGSGDPVRALAEEMERNGTVHKAVVTQDILQCEVSGDDQVLADMLRTFLERGITVTGFREQEADLEQAFLKVTDAVAAGSRRAAR